MKQFKYETNVKFRLQGKRGYEMTLATYDSDYSNLSIALFLDNIEDVSIRKLDNKYYLVINYFRLTEKLFERSAFELFNQTDFLITKDAINATNRNAVFDILASLISIESYESKEV